MRLEVPLWRQDKAIRRCITELTMRQQNKDQVRIFVYSAALIQIEIRLCDYVVLIDSDFKNILSDLQCIVDHTGFYPNKYVRIKKADHRRISDKVHQVAMIDRIRQNLSKSFPYYDNKSKHLLDVFANLSSIRLVF